MSGRVPDEWLDRVARIRDLSAATVEELFAVVGEDAEVARYRPDSRVAVHPLTGLRTVYSPARAARPHDHPPSPPPPPKECLVCAGKTTDVVDVAPLSGGQRTFVNLNLFPVVWPAAGAGSGTAAGVHLLQWVSTDHGADLHNLGPDDLAIVLERLGVVEDLMYRVRRPGFPETGRDRCGHVGIVKNVGRLVGGSMEHGHQQLLVTNVCPRALALDAAFREREGRPFSAAVLDRTPPELDLGDYDGRFRLVVPWYMVRPLDMLVVSTDPEVQDVRDLDPAGRRALARALGDATRAVVRLMPDLGREIAYNLAFHNGVAGGLYVDVLPYTQERGGYEALGLALSEGTPEDSARSIRRFLREGSGTGPRGAR